MVSIVMPAYNAAGTLCSSIDSVITQTYSDWELLIIDDASQDETPQIAQAAARQDNRIRYLVNEYNLGTAETRNRGVAQAGGEWIAFLDSDDLWKPDKLEKQLKFIEETSAVISYTATSYLYDGVASSYVLRAKRELTYKELLKRNLMSCSSVMLQKILAARYPFTEGGHHEDYAVWLQILREINCTSSANRVWETDPTRKTNSAYGLNEPLLIYRIMNNSKSRNRFRSGFMTYKTYLFIGYGYISSFFLTLRYSLHSISKRLRILHGKTI